MVLLNKRRVSILAGMLLPVLETAQEHDVLSVNSNFLMLHASVAGKKRICLPEKRNVNEIFSGKVIGRKVDVIEDEFRFGETKIYYLHE